MLTEASLAIPTVSHAVRWADAVFRERASARGRQPHSAYVELAHSTANRACETLPDIQSMPTAKRWHSFLSVDASPLKLIAVGELDKHLAEVFSHGFNSQDADPITLHRWALEVGSCLSEARRSPNRLTEELVALLGPRSSRSKTSDLIIDHLLTAADREHMVLVGVMGARNLVGLEEVEGSDNVRQVHPGLPQQFQGWGHAGGKAAEFLRGVSNAQIDVGEKRPRSNGPDIFLSVRVSAADTHAAVGEARRVVGRLFDQYLAGHPTVNLSISPLIGSARPDRAGSFTVEDVRGISLAELSPLSAVWPERLMTALKMANLMRASDAPLTRAALSWVALEAAGIKPTRDDRTLVGKVIALHSMRQLVFRSYRNLLAGAGANNERSQRFERRAHVLRRRAVKLSKIGPASPKMRSLHRASALADVEAALNMRLVTLSRQDEQRRKLNLVGLGVAATDSSFSGSLNRLVDFDQWARLLAAHARGGEPLGEQEAALRSIYNVATPTSQNLLDQVSCMAESPTLLAAAMRERAQWLSSIVGGLYTSRNLHLHSGVERLRGGVNLGDMGPLVVDALFEVWGIWYSIGHSNQPGEVLKELGRRFDDLMAHLDQGGSIDTFHLGTVTGPDWP